MPVNICSLLGSLSRDPSRTDHTAVLDEGIQVRKHHSKSTRLRTSIPIAGAGSGERGRQIRICSGNDRNGNDDTETYYPVGFGTTAGFQSR
ncbi:MAG: hypothetical protein CMJ62_09405 [Planctomycetaceae bacterium]|nr:hypothetical protein [Planctomycetaceae bacterium]